MYAAGDDMFAEVRQHVVVESTFFRASVDGGERLQRDVELGRATTTISL